ncbi:hypothetical protein ACFYT4_34280 [Streptomyces sp. NPDC004609]|uniref:hypothetical protein n=1 Tax=Streptomyces sp. NPDC004609 TaxID=3364704 RepID=UPI0036BADF86
MRFQLTRRAQLAVWPDLLTDVAAAVASLPDPCLVRIIREDEHGRITSTVVDETPFEAAAFRITGAWPAGVVSLDTDERHPLFTAVLPDNDGVLRARRQTEPTPSDRGWAFLKTLRRGRYRRWTFPGDGRRIRSRAASATASGVMPKCS